MIQSIKVQTYKKKTSLKHYSKDFAKDKILKKIVCIKDHQKDCKKRAPRKRASKHSVPIMLEKFESYAVKSQTGACLI